MPRKPLWSRQDEEANFFRTDAEKKHYAEKRKRQGVFVVASALSWALDRVYGLPEPCQLCGSRLGQPHSHCACCDSPFDVQLCSAPGCTVVACTECMRSHLWQHVERLP